MAKAYSSFLIGLARTDSEPFLDKEKFTSLETAREYASSDPTAYPGQQLFVVADGKVTNYYLDNEKNLVELGADSAPEWQGI